MVGDSHLPPVGVLSRCLRRPAWAAAQQYPLLLPGADPLEPGSSGAAVSSLKRNLPFSSSRGGKKTTSLCPWGFHSPPRSSAFKFCRTSINNASGRPRKASKIPAPCALSALSTQGHQDTQPAVQLGPHCPRCSRGGVSLSLVPRVTAGRQSTPRAGPSACVWFSCAQPSSVRSGPENVTGDP